MSAASARWREAARLMRERAEAATPGPWGDPTEVHYGDFGWYVHGSPAGETEDTPRGQNDAAHIASWHPAVALAVAAWLDDVATDAEYSERFDTAQAHALRLAAGNAKHATAITDAYLGDPS